LGPGCHGSKRLGSSARCPAPATRSMPPPCPRDAQKRSTTGLRTLRPRSFRPPRNRVVVVRAGNCDRVDERAVRPPACLRRLRRSAHFLDVDGHCTTPAEDHGKRQPTRGRAVPTWTGRESAIIDNPPIRYLTGRAIVLGCKLEEVTGPVWREWKELSDKGDTRRPRETAALNQATICSSCVVLFRRCPPSAVTVTMSSMRTPKRPGR
jgi:hypothetical protein